LLAIIVLLVIMNWFFHKVYWGGWICMHTHRKRHLLKEAAADPNASKTALWRGLALLGFASLYREGFEIVSFPSDLQFETRQRDYAYRSGNWPGPRRNRRRARLHPGKETALPENA
jgi:hypothetical protein